MKRSVARNWQGPCKACRPGRLAGGRGAGGGWHCRDFCRDLGPALKAHPGSLRIISFS